MIESNKRIVYKDDDGNLCVIVPTNSSMENHTIEELAVKDVPEGKAYKIVTTDDLPSDRVFRDAWDIDDEELTDGTGGSSYDWS